MPPPPDDYIAIECDHNVTVVQLQIESLMSPLDVKRLGAELDALINDGARKLVLDLRRVQFAGSAALGMLINVLRKIESVGGYLVLTQTERIDQLLKVAKARSLFRIATDPEKAVEMLKSP
jgi:anti-anti-sigma factor